ncbi:hypothetical protein AB9F34_33415, partial [Rhizobium leguminosarum]
MTEVKQKLLNAFALAQPAEKYDQRHLADMNIARPGVGNTIADDDYDYATDFAARSSRQKMLVRRMFQHAD